MATDFLVADCHPVASMSSPAGRVVILAMKGATLAVRS